MPINQTYYLDSSSLETATSVYQDSDMLIPADDGYYSSGSISRRQVGGILLAIQPCTSCLTECGFSGSTEITEPRVSLISANMASSTGLIIVRFNSNSLINGILVEYDGVYYNKLSSPLYGPLVGSPTNKETYIGESPSICALPIIPSFANLPIYKFVSGSWRDTSSIETISIASSQVQTTVSNPGTCLMVIPKPNIVPTDLNIKIVSACDNAIFDLSVDCPIDIPQFEGSERFDSPFDPLFCEGFAINIYYFVSVNSLGTVGLYDFVFSDSMGQTPLADGFYRISPYLPPNDTMEVSNGIVINILGSSSYCA
jgi:hypothetical protein